MHRITQNPNVGQADGLEKDGKVSPAGRYAATMLQDRGNRGRTMTRDRGRKEVNSDAATQESGNRVSSRLNESTRHQR